MTDVLVDESREFTEEEMKELRDEEMRSDEMNSIMAESDDEE